MNFNLNSAWNWLKEKKEKLKNGTLKEEIKKDVSSSPISMAQGEDREKYLKYCISLLDDVPRGIVRSIPSQLRMANGLSGPSLAKMMQSFMLLKLTMSEERMALAFRVEVKVIRQFEDLCMLSVQEAIRKRKLDGVPIVGAN